MKEIEEKLNARAVARRELEQLAALDPLDDGRINATVARTQGDAVGYWTGLLGAVARFTAAQQGVDSALEAARERHTAAEAELARLSQSAPPPPGSREWERVAHRVRELESHLSALQEIVSRVDTDRTNYTAMSAAATRARLRVAIVLKDLAARRAVANIQGATERYWHHAFEVLRPIEEYESFASMLDAAAGEAVPGPMIVYEAAKAWERLTHQEEPHLEWPVRDEAESVSIGEDRKPTRGRIARAFGLA